MLQKQKRWPLIGCALSDLEMTISHLLRTPCALAPCVHAYNSHKHSGEKDMVISSIQVRKQSHRKGK